MAERGVATASSDATRGLNGSTDRVLTRRRPLPGGRAVAGALLVTVSILASFTILTGASSDHRRPFVVAAHDLRAGQTLKASDLTTARLDLPSEGLARRAFTAVSPLVGAVVVAPLSSGELVQASQVVRGLADSRLEVSVPVERARAVGGALRPGDVVDVASTVGSGADAYTEFVVRAARVVAVDGPKGGLSTAAGDVITLSVASPTEALAVTHAFTAGQINLVRVTGDQGSGPVKPFRSSGDSS